MNDTISRQAAIDALWKALYDYEDRTEKQFMESDELDIGDWIQHRIFVQNMSDIDRQTILNLPSVQPEIIRCKDCKYYKAFDYTGVLACHYVIGGTVQRNLDDFCSRAERLEEGEPND